MDVLKLLLDFIESLVWPAVVLTGIILFRQQVRSLIQRLKSGEAAGVKFNFNEAASGFIKSTIDELAVESDASKRVLLAGEIKGMANVLNSIHPISLAILIDGAQGYHAWVGGSYTGKKQYFDMLEDAGLAVVELGKDEVGEVEARLRYTDRGKDLIESIGMNRPK